MATLTFEFDSIKEQNLFNRLHLPV